MSRKSQTLLLEHETRLGGGLGGEAGGSESYSSNSSFTDSYSDSSDLANWEEYVAEDGTLFYAEYLPHLKKSNGMPTDGKRIEFTRSSSLRVGKKTARRQQQQQQPQNKANGHQQQQQQQQQQRQQHQQNEFKVSHIKAHDVDNYKQLELVITAADRFRFGRRSTAVESILGFRVVPFVDQTECLMFDSFVHDMPEMQQQQQQQRQMQIKRGDWFRLLDDIEIRTSNVDELLLQFIEPTKVCLKFQAATEDSEEGATGAEGGGAGGAITDLKKVQSFAMFAGLFEKLQMPANETNEGAIAATSSTPFAILILPPECYQNDEHKNSLYYYPEDAKTNFLYKARGSFLTLNAVLTEELQTKPLTSKLSIDNIQYYVSYRSLNSFLVLFAYSAEYQTMPESTLRSDELIHYIRFAFPTLCLENFAHTNETSLGLRKFLFNFCEIQRVRMLVVHKRRGCLFEELLKESRHIPLPKEAQLRIFDALSEMEAMDYRNWNDEPLNTHREFFIYGSVLYYDHFLLASQMPVEVRANVERFLRCRGIFDFISTQSVKELYVWEEIQLPNAAGRYFLTICSRSHLILAVILKIFDAPDLPVNATISPSLFYIEEIQETLDHLIQCGIESLAMFWSISNKRPEVLEKVEPNDASSEKDSRKLETFIKQKLTSSSSSSQLKPSISYDEEAAHLCSSLGGSSSIHSLTPSEDDSSKRRLMASNTNSSNNNNNNNNNNNTATADDSDSCGSDWDNFTEQNPLHYGLDAEAQTQMTESLWKEINNVVPVKISAGWKNSVFFYVHVDSANGSVFCPLKANSETFPFLKEMRKACHLIHNVLQNTKNFRRLLATETTKTATSSKGMLAIKEHGITIQVRDISEQSAMQSDEGSAGGGGAIKGSFVVVGRLFFSPTKEVYVCHRPDVPQNMVEMAFRLSFFSVG